MVLLSKNLFFLFFAKKNLLFLSPYLSASCKLMSYTLLLKLYVPYIFLFLFSIFIVFSSLAAS